MHRIPTSMEHKEYLDMCHLFTWFWRQTQWFCSFQSIHTDDIFFSGTGEGVRFSLRGTTYQNNSIVTLEDIGESDGALLCVTDLTACCRIPYTGLFGVPSVGNWFFPNGTRALSSGSQWDFHRTRGQMVVLLHRRRSGVNGIYNCVVPDATNVIQTIYIGVYTSDTGICKCNL